MPARATPSRKRFALTGRSLDFDPRVTAARGDLADLRLADRIFAPHYAAAVARTAIERTPLLAQHGGEPVSELLRGERFDVLELSHGYAWGIAAVDGAVGFVAMDALGAPREMTHVVCANGGEAPVGTCLTADEAQAGDSATMRPLDKPAGDFVALAEGLVGTSTVAGGRSSGGVDSGGLVSLTLSLAGIRSPRYPDLQAQSLGHEVSNDAPVLRGDLFFTDDGNVAIATGDGSAIRVGATAVERVGVDAIGPVAIRRRLP
ncbi:NlpC/P60 family protein [Sphingomonas sp. RS2018]